MSRGGVLGPLRRRIRPKVIDPSAAQRAARSLASAADLADRTRVGVQLRPHATDFQPRAFLELPERVLWVQQTARNSGIWEDSGGDPAAQFLDHTVDPVSGQRHSPNDTQKAAEEGICAAFGTVVRGYIVWVTSAGNTELMLWDGYAWTRPMQNFDYLLLFRLLTWQAQGLVLGVATSDTEYNPGFDDERIIAWNGSGLPYPLWIGAHPWSYDTYSISGRTITYIKIPNTGASPFQYEGELVAHTEVGGDLYWLAQDHFAPTHRLYRSKSPLEAPILIGSWTPASDGVDEENGGVVWHPESGAFYVCVYDEVGGVPSTMVYKATPPMDGDRPNPTGPLSWSQVYALTNANITTADTVKDGIYFRTTETQKPFIVFYLGAYPPLLEQAGLIYSEDGASWSTAAFGVETTGRGGNAWSYMSVLPDRDRIDRLILPVGGAGVGMRVYQTKDLATIEERYSGWVSPTPQSGGSVPTSAVVQRVGGDPPY